MKPSRPKRVRFIGDHNHVSIGFEARDRVVQVVHEQFDGAIGELVTRELEAGLVECLGELPFRETIPEHDAAVLNQCLVDDG